MKKFNLTFICILCMAWIFQGRINAQSFVPQDGEKYSFIQKASGLLIGQDGNYVALKSFVAAEADTHSFIFEAAPEGGYYLKNGVGQYMYYSGYTMTYEASLDPAKTGSNKGYRFDITDDTEAGYYRICVLDNGSKYVASDATAVNSRLYSDKAANNERGVFSIVRSGELSYAPKISFDTDTVRVEFQGRPVQMNIITENITENVHVEITSGFTSSVTDFIPVAGEVFSLEVSSDRPLGTEGDIKFIVGGQELASLPVKVTPPSPRYYIVNIESGLVIGGDMKPVLADKEKDNGYQQFLKIPVPGKNNLYYFMQDETSQYLRKTPAGTATGAGVWQAAYGTREDAEWQLVESGDFVYMKSTAGAGRIMGPSSLTAGATLHLDKLSSNPGTLWEIVDVNDMAVDEPFVTVKDTNAVVEQNGLTFSTRVRALNLNGGMVDVTASDGFGVSLASLTEGFDYKTLVISSTAAPGSVGTVTFSFDGKTIRTLKVTVVDPYDRYIIMSMDSTVALGSYDEDPYVPVLKNRNTNDYTQYFLLVPATDTTTYIIQDGTYYYFGKSTANAWNTTYEDSPYREWQIVPQGDSCLIYNMASRGLYASEYADGQQVFTDRASAGWILKALGKITVSENSVILATESETAKIRVSGEHLDEDIVIQASEGFTVDKTSLPANVKDAEITIGFAGGEVKSGKVTLVSGIYNTVINVRVIHSELKVSKEELVLNGKNASDFFILSGTDWPDDIAISVTDGFTVSHTHVDGGEFVNQAITVMYSGTTSAEGTVDISSGSYAKSIPVKAVFSPEIIVSESQLSISEIGGTVFFMVTAKDLFDNIVITASSDDVEITPSELAEDVSDEVVVVQHIKNFGFDRVTLTLASGTTTASVIIEGPEGNGIADKMADQIKGYVENGKLFLSGVPEQARVEICSVTGKWVGTGHSDVGIYELPQPGVYIVRIVSDNQVVNVLKVVR